MRIPTGAPFGSLKSEVCPILIILLLPLLVNLPGLVEWSSIDPLHFCPGLLSFFHGRQLLRGWPWIDPSVGYNSQALGKLAADEWLSGRIPWWNYYTGVGVPLAAEMTPGAFFLPFVLLNHFSNGLIYIEVILQILAGLGTYFLLRKIRLAQLSAFTGAILFEFSGLFAWYGAPPFTSPVAFLPWFIFGVECARERSFARAPGGWLTIAISLAFSIYAGFPETAYIDGLLVGVWSLWRVVGVPSEIRYGFIKKLATGALVGLLLSTPIIIPFIEYAGHSSLGAHSFGGGSTGLPTEALPQLFFPWLYGSIGSHLDDLHVVQRIWALVGGFLSAAQLTVIALGLFTTRRSSLYVVLLLWISICLGRTFAVPFLSTLVDLVPLVKIVYVFRYSPPSWEFCSAVLCAIVINDIGPETLYSRKKFIVGLLLASSVVTISLYPALDLVRHLYVQSGYGVFLWISLAWGFGTMAIVAFLRRLAYRHPFAGRAIAIVLIVDAIALFSVPSLSGLIDCGDSRSAGISYLKKHIGNYRFYTLGPIAQNYGAYYRIASINYNYFPVPTSWVQYIKDHLDPYSYPLLFTGNFPRSDPKAPTQAEVLRENVVQYQQIGVRYVVTSHSQNPFELTSNFAVIDSGNKPFNLANGQGVAQRVFQSSDMDIYELPGAKPYFQVAQGSCDLEVENRSVISVSCSSETQLVRRELYYPGWRAYAGGKQLHIEPYKDIFQMIRISPGQYKITFSYVPTHIHVICGSFLLGVSWLILGIIRSRPRYLARNTRVAATFA